MTTNDKVLVPRELDEAINGTINDLDMIACGCDPVTGDRLSFAQVQTIAKEACKKLYFAWENSAAPQPAEDAKPDPSNCSHKFPMDPRRCHACGWDFRNGDPPQPADDRKVGCEGEDGLLRVHSEATTCDACRDDEGETNCPHEAWEENHGARRCADCRAYLEQASVTLQPAEDELPGLPKSFGEHCVYDSVRVMREPGYTADQMLAFRAEGIAYAQQRSAAVVVDEAMVDRAYARFYRPLPVDRTDLAWIVMGAALTAALSREEG